ncbi:unnamed protein product [Cladocopium goreaui]|uniref:Uncharacterized protein n=1 Tax=Cladocopium goreaui TaxID=2562237 RepID=A0A9P1BXJ5_9DINO|nr:unnamed protein product [Cladocopium goreaui]
MSFDFDPTSPQQQLDPNPDINDTGLQWWSNETRENAERAVIAARQADMALHVAKTASNMAIAAAGHLIRDNLLANTKMSMRTYSKLMKEPDYVHWDGVLGGRDKEHPAPQVTQPEESGVKDVNSTNSTQSDLQESVKVAFQAPLLCTLTRKPRRRVSCFL